MKTIARILVAAFLALPFIAAAQVSNQQILSQIPITYKRTTEETTAGVTPTNYGYLPGNVLRYGADPSGVADSTTAVSRANASLNATKGGNIYFPTGIYKVTSVTISRAANVYGDGIGSTQIYAGDAASDVFAVTGSSVAFHDFTMSASVTRTGGRYFYAKNTSSVVQWYNLYLLNWFIGIDLEGTDYSILNVEERSGVPATGNGVAIGMDASPGTLSDISIINLRVDNPTGSKPFSCIQLQASGDVTLIDTQLQHCVYALAVQPNGTSVVSSLLAVNTFFDNSGTTGLLLQPRAAGAAIVRARFNGCWFSSSGSFGIQIDNTGFGGTIDGVTLIDPQVLLNGSHGIVLNGAIRTKIVGGAIAGNTGVGMIVFTPTSQWEVQDATIGPWGAIGGNTTYGLQVTPGASNNYIISGNDLRGNTTAALNDGGTGTAKIIKGNLGYNPIASTAITVTASPFTFTNNTGDTANVFVTGGTVSSVTVGGNAVATATNTMQPVPQGASIVVTYTVAPTMTYLGY